MSVLVGCWLISWVSCMCLSSWPCSHNIQSNQWTWICLLIQCFELWVFYCFETPQTFKLNENKPHCSSEWWHQFMRTPDFIPLTQFSCNWVTRTTTVYAGQPILWTAYQNHMIIIPHSSIHSLIGPKNVVYYTVTQCGSPAMVTKRKYWRKVFIQIVQHNLWRKSRLTDSTGDTPYALSWGPMFDGRRCCHNYSIPLTTNLRHMSNKHCCNQLATAII